MTPRILPGAQHGSAAVSASIRYPNVPLRPFSGVPKLPLKNRIFVWRRIAEQNSRFRTCLVIIVTAQVFEKAISLTCPRLDVGWLTLLSYQLTDRLILQSVTLMGTVVVPLGTEESVPPVLL